MRILGIDPGSLVTGLGSIDVTGSELTLHTYELVRTHSKDPLHVRLKKIYDVIYHFVEKENPDRVSIETAFYGKNAQSALKLGMARGVAMTAIMNSNHKIELVEFSPRLVKKLVVGNGNASKYQVSYMVGSILGLSEPIPFDASDALALAISDAETSNQHNGVDLGSKSKKMSWSAYVKKYPERIIS